MNETLKVLHDALAECHGSKETVAIIYCDNDTMMHCEAFVGDAGKCAAAIQALLGKVGTGAASPADCAITFAVLMGIAAADLEHGGALTAAIENHKKDILASAAKPAGEA